MQEGPISKTKYYCSDCVHLKTEYWEFYGENDDTESGIDAECLKENRDITSYWNKFHKTPEWCPYLK